MVSSHVDDVEVSVCVCVSPVLSVVAVESVLEDSTYVVIVALGLVLVHSHVPTEVSEVVGVV